MKLSTKITAVAVGLLILLSQIFSIGNLMQMRRKMLSNIMEYEWMELEKGARDFGSNLQKWHRTGKSDPETEELKPLYGKMAFYLSDCTRGVLYYGDKEIVNSSPYEFYVEKGTPVSEKYFSVGMPEAMRGHTFLECSGEKRLLILFTEVDDFRLLYYRDVSSVYREVKSLFFRGIGEAFVLAWLLAAILILIIQRILKPFYELQKAANVIAGGNYSVRVEKPGKDEVGAVAGSFNQMADKVEAHVRELTEANEKQQMLLGALAHELKTPMTGIQGYAQLLQKVELPPKRQAAALGYIEEECRRLSRLSVKMLQLTELSSETQIEKKPIRVIRLFREVEETVGFTLHEKNIHLKIRCPKELEAEGDRDLLASFLMNLIDNAYKASEEGGCIWLSGTEEGIFVQDEGRGIPREEIRRVAEPFYMVDKSRSRTEGGAGLGLALCSQIARLHGGRLDIISEPGNGTKIGLLWI